MNFMEIPDTNNLRSQAKQQDNDWDRTAMRGAALVIDELRALVDLMQVDLDSAQKRLSVIESYASHRCISELDDDGDPLLHPYYVEGTNDAREDVLRILGMSTSAIASL